MKNYVLKQCPMKNYFTALAVYINSNIYNYKPMLL